MSVLKQAWRYWKWLCVALMTSFVVLAVVAALVISFKIEPIHNKKAIEACLDSGGTWDAEAESCKSAA